MNCYRGDFTRDQNYDGVYTITDLWAQAVDLMYIPADALLAMFADTRIGQFLELSCDAERGVIGAIFSLVMWYLMLGQFGLFDVPKQKNVASKRSSD